MGHYSEARRASALKKLLPPYNQTVTAVSAAEGISTATLYNWRNAAKQRGVPVPGSGKKTAEQWNGEAKLAVVLETASLNAEELSQYCRSKGLYPEQVADWKQACIAGADSQPGNDKAVVKQLQALRRDKHKLEKQLRRKDKALAESASPAGAAKKVPGAVGGRGRMTSLTQRTRIVTLVDEAVCSGARRCRACEVIGLSVRTLQRWRAVGTATVTADQRPGAHHPAPPHQLTTAERERIIAVCNQPAYAHLPPSQIVPRLADQGEYVASESSFYRVLNAHDQVHHRGSTAPPRAKKTPTTHVAEGPNQVWTWDVTWLPSDVRGRFFYLYMISDLYSRYGVHWEVHERECGERAATLIEQAVWRQRCSVQPPVLHSDNGGPMKSLTLRSKLVDLQITPSYSRPRVSNDNAFIESFFRTLKHGPITPPKRFATVEQARQWVARFMQWYNEEHQHSGIRYVTPGQRHRGEDKTILAKRQSVYATARKANPKRWTTNTRNWSYIKTVTLNPERTDREAVENAA